MHLHCALHNMFHPRLEKKSPHVKKKKSAAAAQTAADVPEAAHGSAPSPRVMSPGAQGAWPVS